MSTLISTPNRLIHATSPYLRQHSRNPVDWYPWSEEAFKRAAEENKPVFLSIGYSSCHWCHVMAHESFEDEEIAGILNREYISVKVDREERPDVDAVYISVCQAMNGQGGWPLTILMTPEKQPFFAATYLPPHSGGGMYGLKELLLSAAERWKTHAEEFRQSGEKIIHYLQNTFVHRPAEPPDRSLIRHAAETFQSLFDDENGGFGTAPKFPSPHNLLFLMRCARPEKSHETMYMAEKTLTQMYRGGLFDHVGGGFCRYSTDAEWLVPHFEKMLYDNAQLADVYLEAYLLTGEPAYRETAIRTLDYMKKEMETPEGAFYSSQDADSDGFEGKYYLLHPREIREWLGEKDGEAFCAWYDITEGGNFKGGNIPNLLTNPLYKKESPEIGKWRQTVGENRKRRMRLHRDEKILTAWNSLAIMAFTKAAGILKDAAYLKTAQKTEEFVSNHLTVQGRLCASICEGKISGGGYLEDYAYYCLALLSLYRATFDIAYLEKTVRYAQLMLEMFSDETGGGLYLYAADAEQLIMRPKEVYDGALPSGNAAAADVLLSLARLTEAETWRATSDKQLRFLTGASREFPTEHSYFLLTLLKAFVPQKKLICFSPAAAHMDLLREIAVRYPEMAILVLTPENAGLMARLAPFTAEYETDHTARYQLCTDNKCSLPVSSPEELPL